MVAPANPKAVAAVPLVRKFRRLTGAPATGGPANAEAGSQQTHREKKPRRHACLLIALLRAPPRSNRKCAAIVGAVWRRVKRARCPSTKMAASTIRVAAVAGEREF